MKVKLPRKRKKAFIKSHGSSEYLLCRMAGEVMTEENIKNAHKFPDKLMNRRKQIYSYW